jgi:hypothetical protein
VKDIKDYIEKLWNLEIFTSLAKFDWEEGYKKRYSNLTEVTNDNLNSIDFGIYDFLVINLMRSNLICLDIEGHPNSVNEFYQFLEKERIDIKSLSVERTMNNGLHIYFRNTPYIKSEHWNGFGNIHYDILNKRAFTSPSAFGGKSYECMYNSFESIKKRDDIPTTPLWISYMLSQSTKYFTPD